MPPEPEPFEQVRPTYGIVPVQQPDDVLGTRDPGAWPGLKARWEEGYFPKIVQRIQSDLVPDDPTFNPWPGIEGYEEYADSLASADSQVEQDMIKAQIDRSRANNRIMAANEWGMAAEIMGGLAVGLVDPSNLVPIPIVKGLGMLKGALKMGTAMTAISAGTEVMRARVDPTFERSQMAYSIGVSGLLGALLGVPVGHWGAGRRRAFENLERELTDIDTANTALILRGQDEGLVVELGTKPVRGVDNAPARFSTTERAGRYPMQVIGGENYTFKDGYGVILAADRELDNPRPVGQDIVDEFTATERPAERVMAVDQAGLKDDFTKPVARERVEPLLAEGEAFENVIRHADDYVNFETRREMWKQRLPRNAGETLEAWELRAGKEAMKELKASRVGAQLANAYGIEWLLGRLQRSPGARAIRLSGGDNVIADTIIRIQGDHGVAMRSAEFGFRAPTPIMFKAMQHVARWHDFVQEFDREWLRYSTGQKDAAGKVVLNYNLSAAAASAKAAVNRRLGQNVLTYDDFSEMVGMAVYSKDDFELRGHKVNEHARNAAKAFTRMMQEMDEQFSAANMFEDQKSLTYHIRHTEKEIVRLKHQAAKWLFGQTGEPSSYETAISIGGREWTGSSHDMAERNMIETLGAEGLDLAEQLRPFNYGYETRITGEQILPTAEPVIPAGNSRKLGLDLEQLKREARELEALIPGSSLPDWDELTASYQETLARMDEIRKIVGEGVLPEPAALVEEIVAAAPEPHFITIDEMINSRVQSLSPKQKAVYDSITSALRMAEEHQTGLTKTLEEITKRPHRFLDAAGNPEPYYTRFWNTAKMVDEREKVDYLFQKWFERDNPHGAAESAKKTVDNITLDEEEGTAIARLGKFNQLNRRALNIPNSWKVEHPVHGTIRLGDYIDNNVLGTSETYMTVGGQRLELARMFGEADMASEKARLRQHMIEQYYVKETTDEGRAARMAWIEEIESYIDLSARWAMGQLRSTDPWRWDNRLARFGMDLTSLAVMGKIILTAIPEAARPGMVAGMGTAFKTIYMRMFSDMEQIRHNAAFNKLLPDLLEMNARRSNVRYQEMQSGRVAQGGTWVERWISDRIPGFFKIVGLTPWTVFWKDMAMSAAQHAVMDESKQLAHAIRTGTQVPKDVEFRLAALGINARDAMLLDSMPIERWNEGKGELILPAVQNWTGIDGRRARELLLTAITAETRRAIVTPTIADKSTVFAGVWTYKGKKTAESDLMKIPMQFLSYGAAAHNKLLISSLQGRDRSAIGGLFWMMALGAFTTYLKTPEWAWKKKGYDELMLESWENAGIGGFWFGDLNQQVERFTGFGLRSGLGMPPKFGKTEAGAIEPLFDIAGSAPSHFYDVSRAFWDSSLSGSQRAQLIRRGVPYRNVIWWDEQSRELAGAVGGAFEGAPQ